MRINRAAITIACTGVLASCSVPVEDTAAIQQDIFNTTLKGANWLKLDDNYGDIMNDARRVSWNLETPAFGGFDATAVSALFTNYQIRTLVRIGDGAKPSPADRTALASAGFSCPQIAGWMTQLDNEAAAVNGALGSGAIAAFIFGNETNLEWGATGTAYARAYRCYMLHWKTTPKNAIPLLVSGPGGCGSGSCTAFYNTMLTNELGTVVDGFTIHAYGTSAFTSFPDTGGFPAQIDRINQFRSRPPIYITEFNMSMNLPVTDPNFFNQRYTEVANYNASHGGQIKAALYFVDALLSHRTGNCAGISDQWQTYSLCNATSRSWWRNATTGGSTPPNNPPSTCDNNVPVGSTACNPSNTAVEFVCANPGQPSNLQWTQRACPSGQACSVNRCQTVATQFCDNNVPLNGTACNPSQPSVQFLCTHPGTANQWTSQQCPAGQSCVGTHCGGGAPAQTCDNNVPQGSTACNPGEPGVQFLCSNPSIPSPGQWTRQACAAGHTCVNTHCN